MKIALVFLALGSSLAFQTVRYQQRRPFLFLKDDDDDEEETNRAMADAFRQLDALESLGDEPPAPVRKEFSKNITIAKTEAATLEQEAKLYTDMAKDLEQTEDLYSDVLQDIVEDMGEDSEVYADMMMDMKQGASKEATPKIDLTNTEESTQDFMDQALQEALKDVKVNNPSFSDSILDDKEIMKEIESIFDAGNDKLLESLDEIRKEQEKLAAKSARKTADDAVDELQTEQMRMQVAEGAMKKMLERVSKETAEVERAVDDLRKAQAEMDKDPIMKLKFGGPLRQGAFIGFVLFSLRSIVDSVLALGDDSLLPGALLQGAIAIACALYFFFKS